MVARLATFAVVAQNIYDDPEFFAAYAGLARSVGGLDAAPEWPTLRSMLPPLTDARVVDLGCGYGWFCRWAVEQGARLVVGIDLSERMLARARADTPADAPIRFERQDLDELTLDTTTGCFDVAYSSLTLHYLADLDRFVERVASALADGGWFVASLEHPVATAPRSPGFVDGPGGTQVWPLDAYSSEGERITDWLTPGVVKQHRTIEHHVRALSAAGLVLRDLVEWVPGDADLAVHPEWRLERERPPFLLLGAQLVRC